MITVPLSYKKLSAVVAHRQGAPDQLLVFLPCCFDVWTLRKRSQPTSFYSPGYTAYTPALVFSSTSTSRDSWVVTRLRHSNWAVGFFYATENIIVRLIIISLAT